MLFHEQESFIKLAVHFHVVGGHNDSDNGMD